MWIIDGAVLVKSCIPALVDGEHLEYNSRYRLAEVYDHIPFSEQREEGRSSFVLVYEAACLDTGRSITPWVGF